MLPEESEAADRAKDGRAESVKPSVLENVVYALSVLMGLFHLYTAYSGTLEAWRQRSIHLIFVLLIFLFGDLARKAKAGGGIRRMLIPYTLLALAVAVSVFMYVDYWNITWREAEPNQLDVIFSTILIALVLITVWKSSGWPITIVVGLFIVYALFGYVLVLTAVSCIILGMGMPAAPAYVIVSALAVPVLTEMKVNVMAAHIFVFYYSIISAITPPVALAAYGAAGIAGADETQVGLTACRLAATAMIVPFIFAYDQALLLMGRPSELIVPIITAFIGVYALSAGLQGWFYRRATILERGLLLVSSVLLMYPERISDWVGLAFVLGVYVYERATSGRSSRVLRGTAG